jgi:hypothetical protein
VCSRSSFNAVLIAGYRPVFTVARASFSFRRDEAMLDSLIY